MLRRLDVERVFLVDVAQGDDVLVAPQGAVVEAQLGVERQHPPVLRDDKGVDLGQRAVARQVEREQAPDQRHGLLELVPGERQTVRQVARLEVLHTERRVRPLAEDLLGCPRRDLLDVHPARLGRHDHVGAAGTVEGHREVELAVDRRGLFHEHRAHLDALGRCLRRLQAHAQDLTGRPFGRRRIVSELDAAGFATPTGVHLGLHDDAAAEALRDGAGVRRRSGDVAARHGNTGFAQQRLGLILVNFHWSGGLEAGLHRGWPEKEATRLRAPGSDLVGCGPGVSRDDSVVFESIPTVTLCADLGTS